MSSSPKRGWTSIQARLLADVRAFDRRSLRRQNETVVTNLLGHKSVEQRVQPCEYFQPCNQDWAERKFQRRIQKIGMLRRHVGEDRELVKVAHGLFIGSIGAARNLSGMQEHGITHILNASPIVPCFFKDRFRYKVIAVHDDREEDIAQFFSATNHFIEKGRRKGAVLVHCFAGQSRSATLVMAYLMAGEGMSLHAAATTLKSVRPVVNPNSGFIQQLQDYEQELTAMRLCHGDCL